MWNVDEWEMLEIGLGLTQPITHGPWIVHMDYLISEFKFELTDFDMGCQINGGVI